MSNKASDMEIAFFLIKHIISPCIEPKTGLNIRDFYVNEAKEQVKSFSDPLAKNLLENYINGDSDRY